VPTTAKVKDRRGRVDQLSRKQKAEGRNPKAEGRRQKAEGNRLRLVLKPWGASSSFRLHPSAFGCGCGFIP
jgi:hypothetical protein